MARPPPPRLADVARRESSPLANSTFFRASTMQLNPLAVSLLTSHGIPIDSVVPLADDDDDDDEGDAGGASSTAYLSPAAMLRDPAFSGSRDGMMPGLARIQKTARKDAGEDDDDMPNAAAFLARASLGTPAVTLRRASGGLLARSRSMEDGFKGYVSRGSQADLGAGPGLEAHVQKEKHVDEMLKNTRKTPSLKAVVASVIIARRWAAPVALTEVDPADPAELAVEYDNDSSGRRLASAGTLEALVLLLVGDGPVDLDYTHHFLSTYRYFTDSHTLMRLLIHQYDSAPAVEEPPAQSSPPVSPSSDKLGPSTSGGSINRPTSPPTDAPEGKGTTRGGLFSSLTGLARGDSLRERDLHRSDSLKEKESLKRDNSLKDKTLRKAIAGDVESMSAESLRSAPSSSSSRITASASPGLARRARVLNVIRMWITRHPEDFVRDGSLERIVEAFINSSVKDNKALGRIGLSITELMAANHLPREQVKGKKHPLVTALVGQFSTPEVDLPPPPGRPVSIIRDTPRLLLSDVLDFKAEKLSQQMALIELEFFQRIFQDELVMQKWVKPNGKEIARNLIRGISWFNYVSFWVASTICSEGKLSQRVALVKMFLEIARYCMSEHNFSSVFSIVSGLLLSPVARLKKTWKNLPSKSQQIFQDLTRFIQPKDNFAIYRSTLKSSGFPLVPYIGVHLADLTFAEDGAPSMLSRKRVNFFKFHTIGTVLNEIRQYQQADYAFKEEPKILQYFEQSVRQTTVDMKELTRLSRALEPPSEV